MYRSTATEERRVGFVTNLSYIKCTQQDKNKAVARVVITHLP